MNGGWQAEAYAPQEPCRCGVSGLSYSENMIRTKICLDEREYALAKTEARLLGIPVAEFIRRAVRQALPPGGTGPWMKFAGFIETGNPVSSQSVDEIVYGCNG